MANIIKKIDRLISLSETQLKAEKENGEWIDLDEFSSEIDSVCNNVDSSILDELIDARIGLYSQIEIKLKSLENNIIELSEFDYLRYYPLKIKIHNKIYDLEFFKEIQNAHDERREPSFQQMNYIEKYVKKYLEKPNDKYIYLKHRDEELSKETNKLSKQLRITIMHQTKLEQKVDKLLENEYNNGGIKEVKLTKTKEKQILKIYQIIDKSIQECEFRSVSDEVEKVDLLYRRAYYQILTKNVQNIHLDIGEKINVISDKRKRISELINEVLDSNNENGIETQKVDNTSNAKKVYNLLYEKGLDNSLNEFEKIIKQGGNFRFRAIDGKKIYDYEAAHFIMLLKEYKIIECDLNKWRV